MICALSESAGFLGTWLGMTAVTLASMLLLSGLVFLRCYVRPTYRTWRSKTNPAYPPPEKIRLELIQMTKGLLAAALCPAIAVTLIPTGLSKAYCGMPEGYGAGYLVFSFVLVWVCSDFLEFFYHYAGHKIPALWRHHKHHHAFPNPSPFSVIADDYVDQFVRALPILLFPLIMPINIDLIFLQFGLFFYVWGVYLHSGHELRWPDAHHPVLNTAYQHHLHHARSSLRSPYHTGFFLKIWDRLFGAVAPRDCACARCARDLGLRTYEQWLRVEKPDYSVLLRPSFWLRRPAPRPAR